MVVKFGVMFMFIFNLSTTTGKYFGRRVNSMHGGSLLDGHLLSKSVQFEQYFLEALHVLRKSRRVLPQARFLLRFWLRALNWGVIFSEVFSIGLGVWGRLSTGLKIEES
jgi:hypothetical protein